MKKNQRKIERSAWTFYDFIVFRQKFQTLGTNLLKNLRRDCRKHSGSLGSLAGAFGALQKPQKSPNCVLLTILSFFDSNFGRWFESWGHNCTSEWFKSHGKSFTGSWNHFSAFFEYRWPFKSPKSLPTASWTLKKPTKAFESLSKAFRIVLQPCKSILGLSEARNSLNLRPWLSKDSQKLRKDFYRHLESFRSHQKPKLRPQLLTAPIKIGLSSPGIAQDGWTSPL